MNSPINTPCCFGVNNSEKGKVIDEFDDIDILIEFPKEKEKEKKRKRDIEKEKKEGEIVAMYDPNGKLIKFEKNKKRRIL